MNRVANIHLTPLQCWAGGFIGGFSIAVLSMLGLAWASEMLASAEVSG